VRLGLVRGSLLREWELPNYRFGGDPEVEVIVSRALQLPTGADCLRLRSLRSPADLTLRLGPAARGALEHVAGSLEYLVGLEAALRGYDIAHALELTNPFTHQAVQARRRGSCQRVIATAMENIAFKPYPNRLVERRANAVVGGIDHCVAISEQARLHLRTAGVEDERITVCPLGIDTELFHPAERAPKGPLRILTVARLERGKGVEDLVVAGGLLAQRGLEVDLTLVGRGPLQHRLERMAADMGIAGRVRFLAVPWRQTPALYREADVFVLASAPTSTWREQFGFAAVEAMASGLPVIAGDSGSLPEVVGRPESLVRPHDPIALAERIERLAADESAREELGRFNRKRAVELFDQRRIRKRLLEIYEAVLERPARD
jgi:glycosyltransferase involved in cell wall biosynthesis